MTDKPNDKVVDDYAQGLIPAIWTGLTMGQERIEGEDSPALRIVFMH